MSEKEDTLIARNGTVLTDDTLDRLAEKWENDTWDGNLTNIQAGRPRIMGEELVNVTFRIPKSRLEAVGEMARQKGETRSQYLRQAIDRALVADAL